MHLGFIATILMCSQCAIDIVSNQFVRHPSRFSPRPPMSGSRPNRPSPKPQAPSSGLRGKQLSCCARGNLVGSIELSASLRPRNRITAPSQAPAHVPCCGAPTKRKNGMAAPIGLVPFSIAGLCTKDRQSVPRIATRQTRQSKGDGPRVSSQSTQNG